MITIIFFLCLVSFASCAPAAKKKVDQNDNKGNTPFFLQDPYDQMCLGPNGFTVCDERALWILTKRAGMKTYSLVSLLNPSYSGLCLDRKKSFFGLLSSSKVGITSCAKAGAKSWSFEFVDQTHVKLSNKGMCLVRGKEGYKNSASMQSCNKGEYLPMVYHPTAVHENGFFLKAADGACFDGSKFRDCTGRGESLLHWGVGVKYIFNEARRYFFNFDVQYRGSCIVAHGKKVMKGDCKDKGALRWSLNEGKLTAQGGKVCLVRLPNDQAAMDSSGAENCEFIALEVPSVYSDEQIAAILKDPNTSEETRNELIEYVQNAQKKSQMR